MSWHRERWLQVVEISTQTGAWSAHVGGDLAVADAGAVAVLALATRLPAGESKEAAGPEPGHGGARLDNFDQGGKPECFVNIVLGGGNL